MARPKRIRLSRARGWRLPEGAIVVARPTRFGNPFRIGDPGIPDAATAVGLFRRALASGELARRWPAFATDSIRARLRGHDLACWCPLDGPCHADALLEIANDD
ncbi:MAG TPA: DUF4326 domain-containing protein [Xanthomonadales bacterium]|nr:DUF4326 domain-containing protein [Xanthomonadales bacterium]